MEIASVPKSKVGVMLVAFGIIVADKEFSSGRERVGKNSTTVVETGATIFG